MQIIPTTVPGTGTLHHARTRHGQRIGIMADPSGGRTLFVYDPPQYVVEPGQDADPDRPVHCIVLDRDEADQLAQLLHDQALNDRIAVIERRLDELAGPDGTGQR